MWRYLINEPTDESLTPSKSALKPNRNMEEMNESDHLPRTILSTIANSNRPVIPSVLGSGSSFSEVKYSTEEMIAAFHYQRDIVNDTSYDGKFVDKVFRGCKFESHSVCLPKEDIFRRFTRQEYLEHRRVNLKKLALNAANDALQSWGGQRSHITHLLWGTMTGGMDSPSMDIRLTQGLGLASSVKRTNIEGMGCLTGFRLLNIAREISMGNPTARILVVSADLRSALGNSLPTERALSREDIVSCALFRDAGSAVLVGSSPRSDEIVFYEMLAGASEILPDSFDHVKYQELNDAGIQLHLSKDLPSVICKYDVEFCHSLRSEAQEFIDKIECSQHSTVPSVSDMDILCHTGGPKILETVAKSLGVDKSQMSASWSVLLQNGNLSGASNLAVLHEQIRSPDYRPWALCLSMGPGMCIEGLILRKPLY